MFFENFDFLPKCEAKWYLIKIFKFVTNCKVLRGFIIASDFKRN